jgi:hypothetical protein
MGMMAVEVEVEVEVEAETGVGESEEKLRCALQDFGVGDERTSSLAIELVLAYNKAALGKVASLDYVGGLALLRQALTLTSGAGISCGQKHRRRHLARDDFIILGEASVELRALTFSNVGCLLKKWEKVSKDSGSAP